jgi:hypothetical protein
MSPLASPPNNTFVAICDTNAMNGEAIPIVSTITTSIRRITGWAKAKRNPSASAEKIGRASPGRCGTLTSATATMTAMKLIELHHSAAPMPPIEITTAASEGPMIRPRFHCAFDNPTAATRSSRGTRSGRTDWNDGNVNAPTHPATKLNAAMPTGVAVPPPTHTARTAAMMAASALPTISIRRLLHRSAIADPIGPRMPFGRKPAAPTSADNDALCVVCAT